MFMYCRNDKNQFWQVNNMFMYCRNDKNQFWHPYYISIKWKLGARKTKLIINKSCGELSLFSATHNNQIWADTEL